MGELRPLLLKYNACIQGTIKDGQRHPIVEVKIRTEEEQFWFIGAAGIPSLKDSNFGRSDGYQRIVCAANRYSSGHIVLGARHFDPLMHDQIKALRESGVDLDKSTHEQGFIDQHRNFLTREEAHVIAKANYQIIRRCGGDDHTLYSENLY